MPLKVQLVGSSAPQGASLKALVHGPAGIPVGLHNDLSQSSTSFSLDATGSATVALGNAQRGFYRFVFRTKSEEATLGILLDGQTADWLVRPAIKELGLHDKLVAAASKDRIARAFQLWNIQEFTEKNIVAIGAAGTLGILCIEVQPACAYAVQQTKEVAKRAIISFLTVLLGVLRKDGVLSAADDQTLRSLLSSMDNPVSLRPGIQPLEKLKVLQLFAGLANTVIARSVEGTKYETAYTLFSDQVGKTYMIINSVKKP